MLPTFIEIQPHELDYIDSLKDRDSMPFVLTPNLIDILENLHSKKLNLAPILKQVLPSKSEEEVFPVELEDPLGGQDHSVTPHLIHQYKNRVLLLTAAGCLGYCRYCFRKNYICSHNEGLQDGELKEICSYLEKHSEVQEVLFSGGDPLSLSNDRLKFLMEKIREARPGILIRICTRALFYAPERFTKETVSFFKNSKPLWIIPHINHPYEISPEIAPASVGAVNSILDSGISMQSQTVLLHGINDDAETLSTLFENLACLGIKPGYLFQMDLAQGTSHFRVKIDYAVELYRKLRFELSGLSLPVFAVDLPGGGGKFNLLELPRKEDNKAVTATEDFFEFSKSGKKFRYPRT